jgi:hypothetical protein
MGQPVPESTDVFQLNLLVAYHRRKEIGRRISNLQRLYIGAMLEERKRVSGQPEGSDSKELASSKHFIKGPDCRLVVGFDGQIY